MSGLNKVHVCFQAIAHYEQSADYYKGEESNRQVLFFLLSRNRLVMCDKHTFAYMSILGCTQWRCTGTRFYFSVKLLLILFLVSVQLTSVCWKWQHMLPSLSSTRKPLRSTSRWGHCCLFSFREKSFWVFFFPIKLSFCSLLRYNPHII